MSNIIDDLITVVIPSSVIKSHPNTDIIDETMASIRTHLPTAKIILQLDGLREEQQDQIKAYNEYKQKILWHSLRVDQNILPFVFTELHHQTDMLKATIDYIKTPYLLYVEQDAPLRADRKIEWQRIIDKLADGTFYTVRFIHEEVIPKEHNYLMIGEAQDSFLKTMQWSQRPHLSSTFYYKDVVIPSLPEKTFIEDDYYGKVNTDCKLPQGWYKHRLAIYYPNGGIQRSYHTDGRAGGRKYTSDDIVWGLV